MTDFHPENLPWFHPLSPPPLTDKPLLMWDDARQAFMVWKSGKMVAMCENGLPNMQEWFDWCMRTYFGATVSP